MQIQCRVSGSFCKHPFTHVVQDAICSSDTEMASIGIIHVACFQYLADHFLEINLVVMRNPAQGKMWTTWGLSSVVNHLPQG